MLQKVAAYSIALNSPLQLPEWLPLACLAFPVANAA